MSYDVSKLKFDICVTYDCDEGEQCDKSLSKGTYAEAVSLFSDLASRTWIDCYYHCMSIVEFKIYSEDGSELDFDEILDGDYSWIPDYWTSSKSEACETPNDCLDFLEDLKNGKEGKRAREVKELEKRIEKLEKELVDSKKKLAMTKSKKTGTMYRAKSSDSKVWLGYTYGTIAGKPIEASTMAKLASSIAYYYHRHAVDLYVSEDGGEKFVKADKKKQLKFSHVLSDAFRLDEQH